MKFSLRTLLAATVLVALVTNVFQIREQLSAVRMKRWHYVELSNPRMQDARILERAMHVESEFARHSEAMAAAKVSFVGLVESRSQLLRQDEAAFGIVGIPNWEGLEDSGANWLLNIPANSKWRIKCRTWEFTDDWQEVEVFRQENVRLAPGQVKLEARYERRQLSFYLAGVPVLQLPIEPLNDDGPDEVWAWKLHSRSIVRSNQGVELLSDWGCGRGGDAFFFSVFLAPDES